MYEIRVLATPGAIRNYDLTGSAAAVIDVLRATSSITQAFSSGCRMLIPAATEDEARGILQENPGALITGERGGLCIEGFDMGNSPREYSPERTRDKVIIMTTSNGTKAILGTALAGASPVLICSFLNLSAVARVYLSQPSDLAIVCSGSHGEFSLEDFACAGSLISTIRSMGSPMDFVLDDTAQEAVSCFEGYKGDIMAVFNDSPHGSHLRDIGFGHDLAFCAKLDSLDEVPVYSKGIVTLPRRG